MVSLLHGCNNRNSNCSNPRSIDIIKMFMLNEDDFAFIYISVGIIDDFDHRSPYQ